MKLRDRGRLELRRNGEKVGLYFESNIPAKYKHPELKETVKGEGIKIELPVEIRDVVNLYLSMKTFEESFKEPVLFKKGSAVLSFHKTPSKPMTLVIYGVNPDKNEAGLYYLDVLNYTYVLLLAYFKEFLSKYPALSFTEGNVEFGYSKEDKMLIVYDRDLEKHHYIEEEEIAIMQELLGNYFKNNTLYTHSFTPDRNIYIDKITEKFVVNDKEFDFTTFEKLVYLTQM